MAPPLTSAWNRDDRENITTSITRTGKRRKTSESFLPSYRGSLDAYLLLLPLTVNFSSFFFFFEDLREEIG